ncbi:hypothetical protein FRC02_000732 [Tulasnella sp. 418]|nr:hypothetical protein FRC02_000732 [Tulasnella sp. 418]
MTLTIEHAHFLAVWLEALIYGIFSVLFFTCVWVLYKRPVNGYRPTILISMLCLIYILNTAHLIGTLRGAELAFFYSDKTPAAVFMDRSRTNNIMNLSIYGAVLVIGDGILIYRCWTIWQRNWWIVAAPIVFLAGTSVTGSVLIYIFSRMAQEENMFQTKAKFLAPVTYALSLLTNCLTTALMVYRIRSVTKSSARSLSQSSMSFRATAVVVESGAIVPLVLILSIALFAAHLEGQCIVTGPLGQIIGVVSNLTVLQVRLGYSQYDAAKGRGRMSQSHNVSAASGTTIRFACPINGGVEYAAPNSPQKFNFDLEMVEAQSPAADHVVVNSSPFEIGYPKSQLPLPHTVPPLPFLRTSKMMRSESNDGTLQALDDSVDDQSPPLGPSCHGESRNEGHSAELGYEIKEVHEITIVSELGLSIPHLSQTPDTSDHLGLPDSFTLPAFSPSTPKATGLL